MNTDSGNRPKVFTLRQNGCSHKTRTGVHFKSESVFTLGQNTHVEARFPETVKKVIVRVVGQDRILTPVSNSWDSFFMQAQTVTDDFMTERATQEQPERETF